ncbi:MAG: hypothetical protein IKT38_05380 [Clostridia bacterium]|nr:hypothetical protein [Clostridia bacterium]
MVVFAMLGTLMFCSKVIMEFLPNIHLLGMFTMVFTLVFRKKALIPIYLCVLITALYSGFTMWWIPYLYIWTILWGITMLLPKKMPKKIAYIIYPLICGLHGLAFGILYAPTQALFFGFNFKQTVAWVISGLPFDAVHAVGNFCAGLLIIPLTELLKKLFAKNLMDN